MTTLTKTLRSQASWNRNWRQDLVAHKLYNWLNGCERFSAEWVRRSKVVRSWLQKVGRPSLFATYED